MINGGRIRQAREIRGLTQGELAHRIGVAQSAIAQFENGTATPSSERLEAIALQTGFPVGFFKQGPPIDFPLGSLLFRAKASMSYIERNRVRQYGSLVYETVEKMEKTMRRISLRLPRQDGDPADAARLTRSVLGLSPDVPVDLLVRPLELNGVLVLALPMPVGDHDAFSLWIMRGSPRPAIVFSTHGPGDRIRFNLAHELGHLVLHQAIDKDIRSIEKEANRFAAEFLMPQAAMVQEITPPVTLMSLRPLALRWKVSVQALIKRSHDLGIISPRQYKYLNQQLSRMGLRNKSLVDIPVERPRALRRMAELLFGNPIDSRKMASELNLPLPLVLEALGCYAEKNRLLYPAAPPKEENGGKLMNFVKRQ